MRYLSIILLSAALAAAGCDQTSQASAPGATPGATPGSSPEASPGVLSGTEPAHPQPIASGEFVDGILWTQPVTGFWPLDSNENVGRVPAPRSRVEVYEDFILVTSPEGVTELSLHGWYTNLQFRRDPG